MISSKLASSVSLGCRVGCFFVNRVPARALNAFDPMEAMFLIPCILSLLFFPVLMSFCAHAFVPELRSLATVSLCKNLK